MNPEERTRIAAGENEELAPPPPTVGRDDKPLPVAPGEGGPDDTGDVDVDPRDLRLPHGGTARDESAGSE